MAGWLGKHWAVAVLVMTVLMLSSVIARLDDASRDLVLTMGIVAIMAMSLALVNGVTGQFSLGHAGLQAVGAYTAALGFALLWSNARGTFLAPNPLVGHDLLVARLSAWLMILLGGVSAALVGWIVALPCARLRGDYLAIVTLGFNEIVGVVIRAAGPIGRVDPGGPRGFNDIPRQLAGGFVEIYLVVVLALVVLWRMVHSSRGLAFQAVREDEVAAESLGVATTRVKLRAFVASSFFAGLAGGLFAFKQAAISDQAFNLMRSFDYVLIVILGGNGPLVGAALAGAGLTWLNDRLSQFEQWRMVLFSFVLLWILISRVQPLLRRGWSRARRAWPNAWSTAKSSANQAQDVEAQAAQGLGAVSIPGASHLDWGLPDLPILAIDQVSLRFGGVTAVDELSLAIGTEECVGLIGPNGAGKSTVFNLATGIYRPTSGQVRVRGESIEAERPDQINARGVARTFQNIRLFAGMSVLDNVKIGCLNRRAAHPWSGVLATSEFRREEAAIDAQAWEWLRAFGLADRARDRAGELPYGAQRRLEMARALATHPRLLLLDEPAAGMNLKEKEELVGLLRQVGEARRVSILLIEHDLGVVEQLCQRVLVLDNGRQIAEGSAAEIRRDPKVVHAYLGSTTEEPRPAPTSSGAASGSPSGSPSVVLSVKDLHVAYGGIKALRGVNLEVLEGQTVALIGANGAGKSSLMRALCRMTPAFGELRYRPASASGSDQAIDLLGLSPHQVARLGIGYVPEGRGVFATMTVRENLLLGAYARSDRASVAADLERMLEQFPRLRQRLQQSAATLSGGEQQMLAIARALMGRPRLLLLDEPSLGLSPRLADEVFGIIHRLNQQGLTILLVEQNARKALEVATMGYVLATGEITRGGAASELGRDPSILFEFLGGEP